MILTEEELQALSEVAIEFRGLRISNVMTLINSHRLLLSANAELSFKNQKYKELIIEIKGHLSPEIHDDEEAYQLVRKINELEELK